MKKNICIAALAAMATSLAQGAELKKNWDTFTGVSGINGGVVQTDGSLHVNYVDSTDYMQRPTFDLSSYGLSMTEGLTFTFTAKGWITGGNNAVLVSFASASNQYLFAVGSHDGTADTFFNSGSSGTSEVGTQSSLGATGEYNLIAVTTELTGDLCTIKVYSDGEQVGHSTVSDTATAAQAITRMTLGGWSGASGITPSYMDVQNMAIYDGAMTADEVYALSHPAIPEPATATLSLLALAGLAARRRRK